MTQIAQNIESEFSLVRPGILSMIFQLLKYGR